jgi:hypothetical protein
MFANAKSLTAAAPSKPKKGTKAQVEVAGIEQYAMVDALSKSIEAIKDALGAEIKGVAMRRFVEIIDETGKKPESFRGIDGGASASLEFRKRASNHALNEAAVEAIRAAGIEPAREVVIPALFAINPKYAGDAEKLKTAGDALVAAGLPDDLIVLQEEKARYYVSDDNMEAACKLKVSPEVLALLSVCSIKSKLESTNMSTIIEFARGLLIAPTFGDAANEAKAAIRAVEAA